MSKNSKSPLSQTFGIEIECVGLSTERAITVLREAGLKASFRSYNDEPSDRETWRVTTDCSVYDAETNLPTCEVVSPVLKGKAGFKAVDLAARALRSAGAWANVSCGLHVHIGAKDMTRDHVLNVVKRYAQFETYLDRMFPRLRRSSAFARPMNGLIERAGTSLASAPTVSRLADCVDSRYYRVNLASIARHNTLEFRHHEGTVDAQTITNWILFLLNFVAASRPVARRGRPRTSTTPAASKAKRVSKRELGLAKIVGRLVGYGCSSATLSAESGYSVNSIAVCISEIRTRWNLKIIGRRGIYRLAGIHENRARAIASGILNHDQIVASITPSAPTTPAPSPTFSWAHNPASLETDRSVFDGMPAGITAFYRERMAVFA